MMDFLSCQLEWGAPYGGSGEGANLETVDNKESIAPRDAGWLNAAIPYTWLTIF
jgi:hypothetical protein